jgi:hypothetical protein
MRWAGHIAHMGEMRKPEGKNHLEDLGTDRRMIAEWILGK